MFYFEAMGHRGAPIEAPENTLISFQRAIRIGVDWIEFDLHESKDGVPVVIHDDTVDRTTNGKGRVSDMTFADLEKLDAGNGQKIPSLQQVIDLARGKVKMDMEIKQKGIEKDVVDTIRKNGIIDQCMVSSFMYDSIKMVKEQDPRIMTGAIMDKMPRHVEECLDYLFRTVGADAIMLSKKICMGPFLAEIRRQNFKIGIWNADTMDEIEYYAAMEPDYLCSNYPERLMLIRIIPPRLT